MITESIQLTAVDLKYIGVEKQHSCTLNTDLHIQSPPPSLKFEAQQLEQAYSQEQYQIRIRI